MYSLLKIGEKAPDFTLTSADGSQVSLSQFRGDKNVVLVFYVKDSTSG